MIFVNGKITHRLSTILTCVWLVEGDMASLTWLSEMNTAVGMVVGGVV